MNFLNDFRERRRKAINIFLLNLFNFISIFLFSFLLQFNIANFTNFVNFVNNFVNEDCKTKRDKYVTAEFI